MNALASIFTWSTPADPSLKPWRCARADQLKVALLEMGITGVWVEYSDARRDGRMALDVGLHRNDEVDHVAKINRLAARLADAAAPFGFQVRVVGTGCHAKILVLDSKHPS